MHKLGRGPADGRRPADGRHQAGASIYIPADIFHSTVNSGWEPLRLLRDIPRVRVTPAASI